MIGIIATVSKDNAIGINGKFPWNIPGERLRFDRETMGCHLIMGALTHESFGILRGRTSIVVTQTHEVSDPFNNLVVPLMSTSLAMSWSKEHRGCEGTLWFAGGRRIFEEGLKHADFIDLTYVDDEVGDYEGVARFPLIPMGKWHAGPWLPHEYNHTLRRRYFTRKL